MHIWKTTVLALSQIVLVATKPEGPPWPCVGEWDGTTYPYGHCVASLDDCPYPNWMERDRWYFCPQEVALHELQQWLIMASTLLCSPPGRIRSNMRQPDGKAMWKR